MHLLHNSAVKLHLLLIGFVCVGHGLKSLDLVCMKKLDTKVNIIPIIAKADTISKSELQRFKVSRLLRVFRFITFKNWLVG